MAVQRSERDGVFFRILSCSVSASEIYFIVVVLLHDPPAPSNSAVVTAKRTEL